MLWVEGERSSSFFWVKISMATKWTLAWPCLPVLEVDMSTILQGRPLMTTWPFLRRAEHCMGKVREAPAEAVSKLCWKKFGLENIQIKKQHYHRYSAELVCIAIRVLVKNKSYSCLKDSKRVHMKKVLKQKDDKIVGSFTLIQAWLSGSSNILSLFCLCCTWNSKKITTKTAWKQ